jgi:hypothetical protein
MRYIPSALVVLAVLSQARLSNAQVPLWGATEFQPLSVTVPAIEPSEPVEFTPIKIFYEIQNASDQSYSGIIQYEGRQTGDGNSVRKVVINPKSTLKGFVSGLAPRAYAGDEISLRLTYAVPSSSPESFGAEVRGGSNFDVAALYAISVDWFNATKTRVGPGYDDVVDAKARLNFAGQPVSSANRDPLKPVADWLENRNMTGVKGNNVPRQTGMAWEPIKSVPGKLAMVDLQYLFVNTESGPGPGMAKVLDIISDGAAAALSSLYQGSGSAWTQLNGAMQDLNHKLGGCQGIVAADTFHFDATLLDPLTNGTTPNQNETIEKVYDEVRTLEVKAPGSFYRIVEYDGLPSSVECGSRSLYHVRWSVQRTSFQP